MNQDAWYLYTPPGGWGYTYRVPCQIIKANPKRSKIGLKHREHGWDQLVERTVANHLLELFPNNEQLMNELMVLG